MKKGETKKKEVDKAVKEKKIDGKFNLNKKKLPLALRFISIWYYVLSGLFVLMGIIFIVSSAKLTSLILDPNGIFGGLEGAELIQQINPGTVTGVIILLSVFTLALGVLYFFIARNLFKLRKWARVVAIIISSISLVFQIINISDGANFQIIVSMAINIFIITYLSFFKEVKELFNMKH